MHPSVPLTPVRNLATAASALIGTVCLVNIYATWTAWHAHSVVVDYLNDEPGMSESDLTAADDMATSAFWMSLLVLLASTATLLTWLWRARVNSERLNEAEHRMSRGWVIGAWFVPIGNLWLTRRVLDDVWRTSDPKARTDLWRVDDMPLSPVVRTWWLLLLANVVVSVLIRFENRRPPSTADDVVGQLQTIAVYSTISTVISAAADGVLIMVVQRITTWQSTPRQAELGQQA